jgi:excisionase family DNA binding protein
MATTLITTAYSPEEFKALLCECVSEVVKERLETLNQSSQETNLILCRTEAAKLLGISLPTLALYTRRGLIKAHRIGTKVRYKRAEVESALILINFDRKRL